MDRKLRHDGVMRSKTALAYSFVVALLAAVLFITGVITLPDDVPKVELVLTNTARIIYTWLETPPLWATCAALVLCSIAVCAHLFGSPRLINFSRVIFRKDARLAEYKILADSTPVIAVEKSLAARRILQMKNWDKIETPDPREFYPLNDKHFNIRGRPEGAIQGLFQTLEQSLPGDEMIANLQDSWKRNLSQKLDYLYSNRSEWHSHEQGYEFQDEQTRIEWHQLRIKTDAANNFLKILESELMRIADSWTSVIPNAHPVRQLLADIELEKLR